MKNDKRAKKPIEQQNVIVLIIIVLVVISVLYIAADIYLPNFKTVDFYEYNKELDSQEIYLVLGDSLLSDETGYVLIQDEDIYLSVDFVREYVDKYIFWDEIADALTVTTSETVTRMKTKSLDYTVNNQPKKLSQPLYEKEGVAFMPATLLKEFYDVQTRYEPDYNMTVVDLATDGQKIGKITQKKSNMRHLPDKKSPILKKLTQEDEFIMYDDIDGYTKIRTKDGVFGYILSKEIEETHFIQPEIRVAPDTSLPAKPMDGKIVLIWDQMTTVEANSNDNRRISHKGLDVLSPTWFSFNADKMNGDIISIADKNYVNWAHANGYQVWALITDNFRSDINEAVLSDNGIREHIINQLLNYVDLYDLDGINVDFEALKPANAKHYLQFFRELYPYMKERGAVLSVDMFVPASYSMYYNRGEVGKTVDYVCVMTYDEHTSVSETSGPVASLGFVEKGISDTINEVPKEKILMGLPYYVRVWREVEKNGKVSFTLSNYSMQYSYNLFIENGAKFTWDAETGSYYGEYQKKEENETVTYKTWLEDENSIEAKLRLFQKYDTAGIAGWKRGLEKPEVWDKIYQYLKK